MCVSASKSRPRLTRRRARYYISPMIAAPQQNVMLTDALSSLRVLICHQSSRKFSLNRGMIRWFNYELAVRKPRHFKSSNGVANLDAILSTHLDYFALTILSRSFISFIVGFPSVLNYFSVTHDLVSWSHRQYCLDHNAFLMKLVGSILHEFAKYRTTVCQTTSIW